LGTVKLVVPAVVKLTTTCACVVLTKLHKTTGATSRLSFLMQGKKSEEKVLGGFA
jgi:hypothetical protein